MRQTVYVVTHGSQWRVKCEHCNGEGIFATQAQAISAARQHVASQPEGTLGQIRVQGENSQWRAEWTYGQDPFPPRG